MSVRRRCLLVALAALCTGLNALKPLMIDDAAYEYDARQMAARPLDPYGFAVYWYDAPMPANEMLAPPVLPYSWALVRRVTGERPWLWKLGLLPWAIVLVFALHALLRRFCHPLEVPGTFFIVLSPLILPGFNLMLDVPALGLALAALALFCRAADQDSLALAAWAGFVAGLAMQTKYTAFLAPGAMLLYAALHRKLRLWPVAALVATQVFVTWEFLTALLYEKSHFFDALRSSPGRLLDKFGLLPFLFSQLGGVFPVATLIGLAALGVRRRWLAAAGAAALAGYAVIVLLDVRFQATVSPSHLLFGPVSAERREVQLAEVIFHVFSLGCVVVTTLVVRRLLQPCRCREPSGTGEGPARLAGPTGDRDSLFLLSWLGLEVLGYLALTPFPAVRRVLGVGIVLLLLIGRLAARTCRAPQPRRTLAVLGGAGVVLGLAFFALDYRGARVHQQAAEEAAAWVRTHGGGRTWYVGHWGFQYYAEHADCGGGQGMRPVVPASLTYPPAPEPPVTARKPILLPSPSVLHAGDWLVVPDPTSKLLNRPDLVLDPRYLTLEHVLTIPASVPLRTVPCYYGGWTALEHHEGPRLQVRIFRVTRPFTARLDEGPSPEPTPPPDPWGSPRQP